MSNFNEANAPYTVVNAPGGCIPQATYSVYALLVYAVSLGIVYLITG